MELFELHTNNEDSHDVEAYMPLAARMRPYSLDDFCGQEDIVSEGKLWWRWMQSGNISSCILYGPPGTGKTTLAFLAAQTTKSSFVQLSAVTSNVDDLRKAIARAKETLRYSNQKTLLFIDEVHRFNKAQQDVLLPHIENGVITFIGATTHNPSFAINAPLVSRASLFRLKPLSVESIMRICTKAIKNEIKGYGSLQIQMYEEALRHIAVVSDGDARKALNALETGITSTPPDEKGIIHFTMEVAAESIRTKAVVYDRNGDQHYDTISAFIKSLRGSDPNAAIYWLSKMLDAGEDIRFIARRMIIFASEDIGNADSDALVIATSCMQAVEYVGLPEARIVLAHAVTYLATAPKSNRSYVALCDATADVKEGRVQEVPLHLRNAASASSKRMGYGQGYKYPHDHEGHYVDEAYVELEKEYYVPSDNGYEKIIKERLLQWKKQKKI